MLFDIVRARRASGDRLRDLQEAAFIAADNDHDTLHILPGAADEKVRLVR